MLVRRRRVLPLAVDAISSVWQRWSAPAKPPRFPVGLFPLETKKVMSGLAGPEPPDPPRFLAPPVVDAAPPDCAPPTGELPPPLLPVLPPELGAIAPEPPLAEGADDGSAHALPNQLITQTNRMNVERSIILTP